MSAPSYELSEIEWKLNPEQLNKRFLLFYDRRVLDPNILQNLIEGNNDLESVIKSTAFQIITSEFRSFFTKEFHRIRTALANHRIEDHPDKFSRYILTNYHGLLKLQDTDSNTKPAKIIFNSPQFALKYIKITLRQITYDLQTLFVNPLKTTFQEDYQSDILPHPYIYAISESPGTYQKTTNPGNKLQWNGHINKLVTLFYDLSNCILHEGQPIIKANSADLTEFIYNNFIDKDGNELSKETIRTILKPGRADKRAPIHKKYNFPF